ncbi:MULTISPECIES: type II toxin-antitoxin system ParD family antitoxin [unclassified Azospirillum]|uniref:ribbon-helix-helix domain-containing protein n=1 Tax=unclassified Azospirillum TaxID=2630922 RepID=UPI000B7310BF|nr:MULTISPECIES: type II toxin-antitoxin system ParD family antitoxin [unclassified Azospirillum]SNS25241.1 putative addiction module antidote protein, CC2985 family [Azospirillum sp. RU38E]SNS43717.1 putative addiction module antidote protein, CC2985 family [Azospirillum sp. RU37A]
MALSATRSVPVPEDMGSFVDDLVARGDYADAADVIRAGLQALRDREDTVEQWLRDEVAPTFDAMKANPARGIGAGEVEAAILAHHGRRAKASA